MPSSTTSSPESVDVVVVGAGPVGLTAAALLAADGIRVLVVERNSGTSDEPKAISLDDESLRTLQRAGLIEQVMPIITPGTGTRYYGAEGQLLFHARGGEPLRLGHPFKNPFAQPDLERVLLRALQADPHVRVEFGGEFVALQQDDDGVTVTLQQVGSRSSRTVRCDYLLGCDGGRSPVREQLGISMTGRSHPEPWLVVDTTNDPHRERYGMHHGDPARPAVVIPGLGGRCRYEFLLYPGEGEPGDPRDVDLIKRLVSPHRDIAPEDVERAVIYRFHGLVADRWRTGRCLLLGDAAHMMPPFAGQGLNSGIRDAANLSWKIAGVLTGRLAPSALDSYAAEREPHATASVRLSERLGQVVMTTDPERARRRDTLLARAMSTPSGQIYLEEMRYRPSVDLTPGIRVPETSDPVSGGEMLTQPRVFDSRTHRVEALDELLGRGWALLGIELGADAWLAARPPEVAALEPAEIAVVLEDLLPPRHLVDIHHAPRTAALDLDGSLARSVGHLRGRFVLVRPDRFLAASWRPGDEDRVRRGLRPFLAGQPPATRVSTSTDSSESTLRHDHADADTDTEETR